MYNHYNHAIIEGMVNIMILRRYVCTLIQMSVPKKQLHLPQLLTYVTPEKNLDVLLHMFDKAIGYRDRLMNETTR